MKQLRGTIRSFFCENKQLHRLLKYFLKFSPCPCFFVFPKVGLFRFGVLGSHTGSLWSGLHFYIGSEITQKRQIPLLVVGGTSQNMVLFGCKSRMVKHVNSITLIPCIAIGDVHPKSYGAKNQQTYFVCKESHTKEGQEKPIKFIWRFKFPTSFGLTFEIVDHQKLGGGVHASCITKTSVFIHIFPGLGNLYVVKGWFVQTRAKKTLLTPLTGGVGTHPVEIGQETQVMHLTRKGYTSHGWDPWDWEKKILSMNDNEWLIF